jgi:hypothetical protein
MTRTISARHTPEPFGQLGVLIEALKVANFKGIDTAKENYALVMRRSACIGLRSFGSNTGAVLYFIFGVLLAAFHTALMAVRRRSDEALTGVR